MHLYILVSILFVTLDTIKQHIWTNSKFIQDFYLISSGCMYSMAAFGPVLGFLLGAYLLSFHMDSFSGTIISIGKKKVFRCIFIVFYCLSLFLIFVEFV